MYLKFDFWSFQIGIGNVVCAEEQFNDGAIV